MGNKKKIGKKAVIYRGLLLILGGLLFAAFGVLYETRYLTPAGADSTTFTTGGIGDNAPKLVEVNEQSFRSEKAQTNNDVNKTLEQKCAELSENSEYEYKAVYGEVILAFGYPHLPCPPTEICYEGQQVAMLHMYAVAPFYLEGEEFMVYTKPLESNVSWDELWSENSINALNNQSHKFCAREIDMQTLIDAGVKKPGRTYRIDHFETVQEIE